MHQGYRVENIILIESYFSRKPKISYDSEEFKIRTNISNEYSRKDDKLMVFLKIEIIGGIKEEKEIEISVKMLGEFTILNSDDNELKIEDFAKINAPAIIFPFIREHIANLSLKAGIPPILLPPINFVKLARESNSTR